MRKTFNVKGGEKWHTGKRTVVIPGIGAVIAQDGRLRIIKHHRQSRQVVNYATNANLNKKAGTANSSLTPPRFGAGEFFSKKFCSGKLLNNKYLWAVCGLDWF